MGSLPLSLECLDLTGDPNVLVPGSEEWKLMGRRFIDALETHGGVFVEYPSDELDEELLYDETFSALRDLFDLPLETKIKINKSFPNYPTVLPNDFHPNYHSLGVLDPVNLELVRAYTQVIWPDGNDRVSNAINRISTKLHQVLRVILEMIFDSYGLRSHYDSLIRNTTESIIMSKYTAPAKAESVVALTPHYDPNFLTGLYRSAVEGLQFKSKEGEWVPVNLPRKASFAIVVGQALEAWSNGRLIAPLHNVSISGDNDRFSCGFFLGPKWDQVIEPPRELVDDQHPRVLKTFIYKDLLEYNLVMENQLEYNLENKADQNTLHMYAGI